MNTSHVMNTKPWKYESHLIGIFDLVDCRDSPYEADPHSCARIADDTLLYLCAHPVDHYPSNRMVWCEGFAISMDDTCFGGELGRDNVIREVDVIIKGMM